MYTAFVIVKKDTTTYKYYLEEADEWNDSIYDADLYESFEDAEYILVDEEGSQKLKASRIKVVRTTVPFDELPWEYRRIKYGANWIDIDNITRKALGRVYIVDGVLQELPEIHIDGVLQERPEIYPEGELS